MLVIGRLLLSSAGSSAGAPARGDKTGSDRAGTARAFRITSRTTERVDTLSVYIDGSSALERGSRVELGLYSSRSGGPRRRLRQCVIAPLAAEKWNQCTFDTVGLKPGANYWAVVLQPSGTPGTVRYRTRNRKVTSRRSQATALARVPRSWRSGARSKVGAARVLLSATRCDVEVADRTTLVTAVQDPAGAGRTVCARAGDYGPEELRLSVRHAAMATLRAYPGERVALPGVVLAGVTNLRVEGFDMPRGGFDTAQQAARNVELVGNEIHDCTCQALRLWDGDRNIRFERNHVHGIHSDGTFATGWGINAAGGDNGGTSGLLIRHNTFDELGNDAMEIGDSDDGEIVANVIKRVDDEPGGPDTHADSIMLWAGSQRWLIKDNRITDGRGLLMSGSTTDVRLENNLIARMKNYCIDGGTTGSSSAGLVRYSWVRNTIYDCGSAFREGGFGRRYGLLSDGPASRNTLRRNLLTDVSYERASQFRRSDHNLIANGPSPDETSRRFVPRFADRIDYRPTNLPDGYEDVGYRAAPAGHTRLALSP